MTTTSRISQMLGAAIALAVLICVGMAFAAGADKPVPTKKGDKGAIHTPAPVTPQGGISFGEGVSPTPAQQHRVRLTWPAMTQQEVNGLTNLLRAIKDRAPAPIMIVCKDPACEDLALNLDNAFESAKWKSNVMIGTQFGLPEGVSASSKWLADLFNSATGSRYGARVDEPKSADGEYLLIGVKPKDR